MREDKRWGDLLARIETDGLFIALSELDGDDERALTPIFVAALSAPSAEASIIAARDAEWVKAIHDACSRCSPSDPQGKPIDPADIKRCVDAHTGVVAHSASVPIKAHEEALAELNLLRSQIRELAERCRPAVAHYMRTMERSSWSEALSPAAKQAAKMDVERLGKLLDDIDAIVSDQELMMSDRPIPPSDENGRATTQPSHTTPGRALDRGDAVNLARNIMAFRECPALTPKGQLCLAEAVLKMDAELTRLGTRSETEALKGREERLAGWKGLLLTRWAEWTGGHISDADFLREVHDIVSDNLLLPSSMNDGLDNHQP